jgi:glucan phosphoethanolaminetransferase (alkaline phosphatase superfamily)
MNFNKKIFNNLIFALLISLVMIFSDKVYSIINPHFDFIITSKELFNKLFIFVLFISFIKNKKIRLSIYILISLSSFFQYVHFDYFGKNINAIEFYLFATNVGETFESLNIISFLKTLPIAISMFILMIIIDDKFSKKNLIFNYGLYLLLSILIALNLQIFYIVNLKNSTLTHKQTKLLYPNSNRQSARNFFISSNYFLFGILPQKLYNKKSKFKPLKAPRLISKESNKTIILIIGESLRYDKFILENNKLTPNLQKLKDDPNFFFKKIYSGGTMTKISVATIINRLKYPNSMSQITDENNCIFKLAYKNDFDTTFISAQTHNQLAIIQDLMCPKYIKTFINRNSFKNYINQNGYDQDLEEIVKKVINKNKNQLIVLQQRGSHSPYKNMYPKEFDIYNPYDNSVLYTDYTLSKFIKFIKNNFKNEVYLFFVSDHGELLGEDGMHGHGELKKEVYQIPFLTYTNTKDKLMKKRIKNVKSHYDLSNIIISLLGYKADLPEGHDRNIYILNSDLDGFSGYGLIKVRNDNDSKIIIKR